MSAMLAQPQCVQEVTMRTFPSHVRSLFLAAGTTVLATAFSAPAIAATLCVSPGGSGGCFASIQSAVNHAVAYDVVYVGPGTYKEDVIIGIPLSLVGAGAGLSTIDATGLPNGVLVDGFHNPGLSNVVVAGFTVENAQFEGILAVSASKVTVSNNKVINNDASPGLSFTGVATGCPGQPPYETDETGDCGGAIHFIGVSNGTVSGNFVTGNADGLLISDDTAISKGNVVTNNYFINNPLECGIVLASHPPFGSSAPYFAPHYGVVGNTVANNVSNYNGVVVGGSGAGLFSDGNGPGRVSENVIINNQLIGNGIGGVDLHTHVGPAFGAPPDNMNNNSIIGNYIAKNLSDVDDTATPPGGDGININSGGGGTPVYGTVIELNNITDEAVDIAVNTPNTVEVHLNNLLGGQVGVANVCAFDKAGEAPTAVCTGSIDATWNYWGCPGGPAGGPGCSTVSGADILFTPWFGGPL
jgi:Right handed beta helix region